MNERITQLAMEASQYSLLPAAKYDKTFIEKFAELIVKECIKLCGHEANKDEYDQYDMGMSVKAEDIKALVKKHFGVES